MTPRIIICAFAIALTFRTFAQEQANVPTEAPSSLTLHFPEKRGLDKKSTEILYAKAVNILASSNFNPRGNRPWTWDFSKAQSGYRETVRGNFLLITFPEPRKFTTVGGDVTVREIVIGLNNPSYASSLFTIDDEARINPHAKYSGPLCIELLKEVKSAVKDL